MTWRYKEHEEELIVGILSLYPIIPPFKSVILRNTPSASILSRHSDDRISIDELYHENSKLSKSISNIENIYGYFRNIKYLEKSLTDEKESLIKFGEMYKSLNEFPERDKIILSNLIKSFPIYLGFYILFKEKKYRLFKFLRPAYLQLIKEGDIDVVKFIGEHVAIDASLNYNYQNTSKIIFIYGNHILGKAAFGIRGYRTVLFDCGRMVRMVEDLTRYLNIPTISSSLFHDTEVNELLGLDGRGFSVHGIILLGEKEDDKK